MAFDVPLSLVDRSGISRQNQQRPSSVRATSIVSPHRGTSSYFLDESLAWKNDSLTIFLLELPWVRTIGRDSTALYLVEQTNLSELPLSPYTPASPSRLLEL